jgi:hypothetical protein
MFLEKHLQNLLETFRPMEMDLYDIKELLATIEPFIRKLEVDSLLTPVVYMVGVISCTAVDVFMCKIKPARVRGNLSGDLFN